MATDFRKKIKFLFQNSFFALFLFHSLIAGVLGQTVVTLNSGGGAVAGDGIKTLVGANGQIQIYRLNVYTHST